GSSSRNNGRSSGIWSRHRETTYNAEPAEHAERNVFSAVSAGSALYVVSRHAAVSQHDPNAARRHAGACVGRGALRARVHGPESRSGTADAPERATGSLVSATPGRRSRHGDDRAHT